MLVIVAAIAALLIVPSFIDWNGFRVPIEREATRLAGRTVSIKGDIVLHMLPSPGFILGDITIADPNDKTAPLIAAKQIDASIAWLPLFIGRLEVDHLALTSPLIRVRIMPGGKTNWSLPPRAVPAAGTGRLVFRNVKIDQGTLLFSDDRNGAQSQASKISGHVTAGGDGPLTAKFDFTIEDQPIRLGLNLSAAAAPSAPFTAALSFLNGGGALTLRGAATGAGTALKQLRLAPLGFHASADLQSPASTSAVRGLLALMLFDTPHAPTNTAIWSRFRPLPLTATGSLDLDGNALSLSGVNGSLGKTRFSASAARGRKTATLNLSISADLLYLDEILDLKAPAGLRFAPIGAATSPLRGLGLCRCEGEVKFSAPRTQFRGAELTDLLLELKLSEAGAQLAAAHITLPGESQLDGSGDFPLTPRVDGTVFDGRIAFNSVNPRLLLEWLGISTRRLAPDALKTLSLIGPFKLIDRAPSAQSGLIGTIGEHYPVPFIDNALLSLDDQRLRFSASYDDRPPRSLLLHLSGDMLDADAYGLSGLWLPAAPLAAGISHTLWSRLLNAGQVDLEIRLGAMQLDHHPVRGFDAMAKRDASGAANAHIAILSFSGYHVLFDAARGKSGDGPPEVSAHLNISGGGAPIKLPFAGKGLPGPLKLDLDLAHTPSSAKYTLAGSAGDLTFKGTGTGPASSEGIPDIAELDLTAHMSQGDMALTGSLGGLGGAPALEGNLTIDALDLGAFLRELGYTYEPRRKTLGAFSLVTQLSANGARVSLTDLAASVGQDNLSGRGTYTFGARDVLDADLKITHAAIADYLPAPEKGALWSPDRLKLDVLRRFDGTVNLTADRLAVGPYDLAGVAAPITLKDGALETKSARASLYGGALSASATAHITDDGVGGTVRGTLNGFDWVSAAHKLFPALGAVGAGRADAAFTLDASGRSMVDLIHSLGGTIALHGSGGVLDGFDLAGWAKEIGGVNGIESFLYLAKRTLTSGATPVASFDISASARRGVIALGTSHIALDGGQGALSGEVRLPSRTLSIRLAAQANAHPEIAPLGIIAAGPIAGPARYYDLNQAARSLSAQLGFSKPEIEPRDMPRDLRDFLQPPPAN